MSNNVYTPDKWVVLTLKYKGKDYRKVFAGWRGGYAQGDSWKLSSGVVSEEEFPNRIEYTNYSGSVYVCYLERRGLSAYMATVLRSFKEDAPEAHIKIEEQLKL